VVQVRQAKLVERVQAGYQVTLGLVASAGIRESAAQLAPLAEQAQADLVVIAEFLASAVSQVILEFLGLVDSQAIRESAEQLVLQAERVKRVLRVERAQAGSADIVAFLDLVGSQVIRE
jgi:hypothetical protein